MVRDPLLPLSVDARSGERLHRQLYAQMRDAILSGRLAPGTALPSSRSLAEELKVARNTVLAAFDQLASEGYVEGRAKSGVYVSPVLPDAMLTVGSGPAARRRTSTRTGLDAGSRRGRTLAAAAPQRDAAARAFAPGVPDCSDFPFELWGRLLAKAWRHPSPALYAAGDAAGYPPLRAAIADYLRAARGVRCTPEQVIIVSGIRQAVDLAARVLLDPGHIAVVEEPGFPGIRAALLAATAEVHAVDLDTEGLQVPRGAAAGAKLVCVAPSHQYPLGTVMSLARRLDLLAWAREADAWILEDDWDSEYRYAGRPLAAMQSLDAEGRVIYVGTLSKVLFPSLRIGYLVASEGLTRLFLEVRRALDDHPSTVAQPALAEFFASGQFAAHVRRMRKRYAARQQALLAAAERHLNGLLQLAPDEAGMHLAADLAPALAARMSDVEAAAAAARAGIATAPLSRYYIGRPTRSGLLLGYAAVPEAEIETGARNLALALS